MAKIYPVLTDSQLRNLPSQAEAKVYCRLRDDLSDAFLIIHGKSYVATRRDGSHGDGEADFVIFCARHGLLTIEVKGGGVAYNPETGWMEGPQIDINPPQPQLTGKLWNEGPGPHRWLSNEPIEGFKFFYADEGDGWNDMEITARGTRIKSVLNGVTLVDYDGSGVLDDELHKKQKVGMKGVIGLQLHSYHQLKLRFKGIRVKPL